MSYSNEVLKYEINIHKYKSKRLTMYTLSVINSRGGWDIHTNTHMNICKVTSQTKAILETQIAEISIS